MMHYLRIIKENLFATMVGLLLIITIGGVTYLSGKDNASLFIDPYNCKTPSFFF